MKKIIYLLSLFLLSACSSSDCSAVWLGGRSNSTACDIGFVSALAVAAPIFVVTQPIRIASEYHGENSSESERYNQYLAYKKGVEDNDYKVIKKCVENCSSRIKGKSYYDPNMQENAAKKLVKNKPLCMRNKEYPIYFNAYLLLIKKQRQAGQSPDTTLLKEAWEWYQNAGNIEYAKEIKTLCLTDKKKNAKPKKVFSLKSELENVDDLAVELFLNTVKQLSKAEQKNRLTQCPSWIAKYQTTALAHRIKDMCEHAYRLHYGLKDKNDTHEETIKAFEKQWDDQLKNSQLQR